MNAEERVAQYKEMVFESYLGAMIAQLTYMENEDVLFYNMHEQVRSDAKTLTTSRNFLTKRVLGLLANRIYGVKHEDLYVRYGIKLRRQRRHSFPFDFAIDTVAQEMRTPRGRLFAGRSKHEMDIFFGIWSHAVDRMTQRCPIKSEECFNSNALVSSRDAGMLRILEALAQCSIHMDDNGQIYIPTPKGSFFAHDGMLLATGQLIEHPFGPNGEDKTAIVLNVHTYVDNFSTHKQSIFDMITSQPQHISLPDINPVPGDELKQRIVGLLDSWQEQGKASLRLLSDTCADGVRSLLRDLGRPKKL